MSLDSSLIVILICTIGALIVVFDVLLVGIILLMYALFHHAIPAWISEYELRQYLEQCTEPVYDPVQEQEITLPDDPDDRTEWQIKFADHFTRSEEHTSELQSR